MHCVHQDPGYIPLVTNSCMPTAPPRRIALVNTYSTYNLGDAAIYSALALMFSRSAAHPGVSGHSIVADIRDARPYPIPDLCFGPVQHPSDLYVSVGGDIFNNSREWLITKQFLLNLRDLRRHPRRTILFGQTLPRSCHGLSLALLTRVLRRLAAVCVRDGESHRRLRQAGVDATLSYDTAFALTSHPAGGEQAEQVLLSQGVALNQAALLSVRGFDAMYGHGNDRFHTQMVQLCRDLVRHGLRPVVLVQSQAYAADNDLTVASALAGEVPELVVFNPFDIETGLQHWQLAMGALQRAAVSIGVRYHTSVLALAAGRLPYNLFYSNKGRDLSSRLGLPGCELSRFESAACLQEILATANQRFDPEPIRSDVVAHFRRCVASAGFLPCSDAS